MRSAQNVQPEFGLWSNLRRKAGYVVAFIVSGSIAGASGLVLQMAGHDANVDGRSVIAAVPHNPGTLLSNESFASGNALMTAKRGYFGKYAGSHGASNQ